jgi:predicted DsbA family dithiol-disulfide isomerase
MYRTIVSLIILFFAFPFVTFSADIEREFKENFNNNLKSRQINDVSIDLKVIKKVDFLPNFYFSKLVLHDSKKNNDMTQYVITDGRNLITDVVDVKTGESLIRNMSFNDVDNEIDVSKLTLYYGKPSAKNKIIEISDFDCPFCRNAFNYIHEKVKNKKDVAVYFMHFPLNMHPAAKTKAKIFEAGMKMGYNFAYDLFNDTNASELGNAELIEYFANKTKDKDKFIQFVNSKEVEAKIASNISYAKSLGVNSTPILYINGKQIRGFNQDQIDKALETVK